MLDEGVADIPTIEAAAKAAFGDRHGAVRADERDRDPDRAPCRRRRSAASSVRSTRRRARLADQVERGGLWPLGGTASPRARGRVRERLLAVTFLIASHLVDEGVCTIEDCDIGARVGLRWARGPFELMNQHGDRGGRSARRGRSRRAHGLPAPRRLAAQAASHRPFGFEVVKREVRDRVATITINRPDALNALNEEVMEQLARARSRRRSAIAEVRGIVLTGAGKAFVAGADLKFFIEHMAEGDLPPIRRVHRARRTRILLAIDRAPKTVICELDGLALGGGRRAGARLRLHRGRGTGEPRVPRDRRSASIPGSAARSARASASGSRSPSTSSLPATFSARARRRRSGSWTRWRRPPSSKRWPGAGRARSRRSPRAARRRCRSASAPHAAIFTGESVAEMLGRDPATDGDELGQRLRRRVRAKAPLALRYAEQIIDGGATLDLGQGLDLELSHLEDVFRSEDALRGMKAVGGAERPAFVGR